MMLLKVSASDAESLYSYNSRDYSSLDLENNKSRDIYRNPRFHKPTLKVSQPAEDSSIYEEVVPGDSVSGAVTAVYVGSQDSSQVNRIEIVTDDFMYSRGDKTRISIPRSETFMHTYSIAVRAVLNKTIPRRGHQERISIGWLKNSCKLVVDWKLAVGLIEGAHPALT